jgi:hypothetical protein
MLVADAADELFDAPPTVVAGEIKSWVANQFRGSNPLPVADYLFHAAKKLYVLEELDLVESERMRSFLNKLAPLLIHACPESDRQMLAENLRNIKDGASATTSVVDRIHKPAGSVHASSYGGGGVHGESGGGGGGAHRPQPQGPSRPAAAPLIPPQLAAAALELGIDETSAAAPTGDVSAGIERLNLLLDRLAQFADATDSIDTRVSRQPALLAEILDEVAADSRDSGEFENRLSLMEGMGLPALSPGLVRSLGQSLPDWAPIALPEGGLQESRNPSARAMRQVIRLARNDEQASARFEEMVKLAVEEFNNGSIGRSVSLLDVAQRMIDAKEIDTLPAQNAVERASVNVDESQILDYASDPTRIAVLSRFMDFFPALQVDALFLELEHEERRDRRRNLIRLLEVHGLKARQRALEILNEQVRGGPRLAWFVIRNLIHVVRSIPRDAEDSLDAEIDAILPASSVTEPIPLVREALGALAGIPSSRAENALITRVTEIEDVLQGRGTQEHDREDLLSLLDTTVRLVGKISSSQAVECVVNHGLNPSSALGSPVQRLAGLAARDLTAHPAALRRLVEEISAEAPTKLFGINVRRTRKSERLKYLMEAVSGTDAPSVRQALASVIERFAGQHEATEAHSVLGRLGKRTAGSNGGDSSDEGASATLAGDLALFGPSRPDSESRRLPPLGHAHAPRQHRAGPRHHRVPERHDLAGKHRQPLRAKRRVPAHRTTRRGQVPVHRAQGLRSAARDHRRPASRDAADSREHAALRRVRASRRAGPRCSELHPHQSPAHGAGRRNGRRPPGAGLGFRGPWHASQPGRGRVRRRRVPDPPPLRALGERRLAGPRRLTDSRRIPSSRHDPRTETVRPVGRTVRGDRAIGDQGSIGRTRGVGSVATGRSNAGMGSDAAITATTGAATWSSTSGMGPA